MERLFTIEEIKSKSDIYANESLSVDEKRNLIGIHDDRFFQDMYDVDGSALIKTANRHNVIPSFVFKFDVSGKSLIDLGCNNGRYMFEFIKRGGASAIGVDTKNYVETFIDYFKMHDKMSFVKANIYKDKLIGRHDIVLAMNMICYIPEEDMDTFLDTLDELSIEKIIVFDHFSNAEDSGKRIKLLQRFSNYNVYYEKLYACEGEFEISRIVIDK